MANGFKTGGRQKGTPNKPGQHVAEILQSLNCDPIEGMARIAMDPKHSPELRGKMFSDLARYVYPQRKAVEHSGSGGQQLEIVVRRIGQDHPVEETSPGNRSVATGKVQGLPQGLQFKTVTSAG